MTKPPLQLLAELESEILKLGGTIPKAWPWAMRGRYTIMPIRCLQLLETVEKLREQHVKARTYTRDSTEGQT